MTQLVSYPVIVEPYDPYGYKSKEEHPTATRYHIFFPDFPAHHLGVEDFNIIGLSNALEKAKKNLETFFILNPNSFSEPSKLENIERFCLMYKRSAMAFPIVVDLHYLNHYNNT